MYGPYGQEVNADWLIKQPATQIYCYVQRKIKHGCCAQGFKTVVAN